MKNKDYIRDMLTSIIAFSGCRWCRCCLVGWHVEVMCGRLVGPVRGHGRHGERVADGRRGAWPMCEELYTESTWLCCPGYPLRIGYGAWCPFLAYPGQTAPWRPTYCPAGLVPLGPSCWAFWSKKVERDPWWSLFTVHDTTPEVDGS